jgi:hypothetical protein
LFPKLFPTCVSFPERAALSRASHSWANLRPLLWKVDSTSRSQLTTNSSRLWLRGEIEHRHVLRIFATKLAEICIAISTETELQCRNKRFELLLNLTAKITHSPSEEFCARDWAAYF